MAERHSDEAAGNLCEAAKSAHEPEQENCYVLPSFGCGDVGSNLNLVLETIPRALNDRWRGSCGEA